MISLQFVSKRGMVRRSDIKGRYCNELELGVVLVTIPRWIKLWMDRQPESRGLLVEMAVVQHFGAEPPEHVKRALERHKADIQQKLDAKKGAK